MSAAEPVGKGGAFVSALRIIQEMTGPRYPAVLAALSPQTRALVAQPPLAVTWIHLRHMRDLLDATFTVGFDHDLNKVTELGRRVLLGDLSTLYRMFIRIASPAFIIERAAKLWATYTRNAGTIMIHNRQDTRAEIEYSGVYEPSAAYWAYQQGTVRAALEATGAKNIRVKIVLGGEMQTTTRLLAEWE